MTTQNDQQIALKLSQKLHLSLIIECKRSNGKLCFQLLWLKLRACDMD